MAHGTRVLCQLGPIVLFPTNPPVVIHESCVFILTTVDGRNPLRHRFPVNADKQSFHHGFQEVQDFVHAQYVYCDYYY